MDTFEPGEQEGDALRGARKRRYAMLEAIGEVEVALSSPVGEPTWHSQLEVRLLGLRLALEQHVDEVEGTDGLLAELLAESPRLANQIRRIEAEHPALATQVDGSIELVAAELEPGVVRASVMETLAAMSRHRQQGADLVYEAYKVDIGGG
ncbi:MAG: hypothetical protein ACR2QE_19390 [Acidimicrobiales bacterium]